MSHVLIVGAGQAGCALAAKLRSEGHSGQITIVGSEDHLPYQRPPLSKAYLLGDLSLDRLYLRPASFYHERNIVIKTGTRVKAVDTIAKSALTGDEVIQYDELVFATGAFPRRLSSEIGGSLSGVYVVRDVADVDAMSAEFVPGRRVLIVGGGYIGLEAAAVASKRGLQVILLEAADRILQRVACAETADYFRQLHKSHGVEIIEGTGLVGLKGSNRVGAAELSDGRLIDVDFVVAGIGVNPAIEVALATNVAVDNGIRTDAFGRTSAPNIWAVGDCASFPYQGKQVRLESVPHAIAHAEAVALNIMGAKQPYNAKPWFWSDQYDVKLQIAGLNAGYDEVVTRRSNPGTSFWYYKDRQLIAVDAANDPRAYMVGKRLIEAGQSADAALVSDSRVDLKLLAS